MFPVRVVLADDHPAVRRNLTQLLDREPDMIVIAAAADLSTAARQVRRHCPDVLVLDVGMRVGSSRQTIGRLCSAVPQTAIVAVTMELSAVFAHQALMAGAAAVVLKDRADDELPAAVRLAAAGEEFVSSRIVGGLNTLRGIVGR